MNNSEHIQTLTTKALDDLTAALEAGQSTGLERFLTVAARFHRYSFRNVMLIVSQRPDATRVAGFNAWKSLGRFVKKGEHGIVIVAPMPPRRRDEAAKATDGESAREAEGGMRFKGVYVFDLSQTDGDPLPELATVSGDPGHYTDRLKAIAATRGIAVDYSTELGTAEGRSSGGRIELAPGLTSAHEFEVLAHELGHELLHHAADRRPRQTEELEAEAIAFAVCAAVGLDAKAAAADYIGLYHGDKEALAASLERVQAAVREILGGLFGDVDPAVAPAA